MSTGIVSGSSGVCRVLGEQQECGFLTASGYWAAKRRPAQPTVTDSRRFAEAASASMRILAAAMTRLTQMRAQQLL